MHRLLVALLAALDAVLAAAGGIAVILAPLTLLWVFGVGDPDWGALWPASAAVWHLGHLVPITVTLPDTYLAATGIDPTFATFTLSLAPLAFAAFTALFAARSGTRAAEAGAALTGWLSGSAVFAGLAALVGLTANAELVASEVWLAILMPSLLFAVPSFAGAFVGSWRVGDEGPVDALRARLERLPSAWADVPALVVRGLALTTLGLVAVGGVLVVAGLIARSSQVIGLYQASNADGIGATVIALGQLAYLPTLVLWAVAFSAGPGFSLGSDTAVTPAATQVGALPGIPVLGAVPESTSSWLLLLALLPIGIGALTGWILRSRMPRTLGPEPFGPRLVVALAVAVLTGGAGALAALAASGSIGPGRLADTGPEPGPLALALGLEVLVGLAILLLSPRAGGESNDSSLSAWASSESSRSDSGTAGARAGAPDTGSLWATLGAMGPGAPGSGVGVPGSTDPGSGVGASDRDAAAPGTAAPSTTAPWTTAAGMTEPWTTATGTTQPWTTEPWTAATGADRDETAAPPAGPGAPESDREPEPTSSSDRGSDLHGDVGGTSARDERADPDSAAGPGATSSLTGPWATSAPAWPGVTSASREQGATSAPGERGATSAWDEERGRADDPASASDDDEVRARIRAAWAREPEESGDTGRPDSR
ncbi:MULTISPECIES: DUF6350 family protein [Microbacterium]|uniref:cell division protein PerM n=1 Tax=Microbacterium TaxID=33882 RepID=UPI002780FDF2|nr:MULTISPECIES: DUF6350 family protein [Microbacterium]MDQ1083143.1 hypothetical protein [Microbacterium sp. SORGH_AS_0344]MDQ1171585.1 hypothetical protein [Microbacterium proteolyticum]